MRPARSGGSARPRWAASPPGGRCRCGASGRRRTAETRSSVMTSSMVSSSSGSAGHAGSFLGAAGRRDGVLSAAAAVRAVWSMHARPGPGVKSTGQDARCRVPGRAVPLPGAPARVRRCPRTCGPVGRVTGLGRPGYPGRGQDGRMRPTAGPRGCAWGPGQEFCELGGPGRWPRHRPAAPGCGLSANARAGVRLASRPGPDAWTPDSSRDVKSGHGTGRRD